MVAAAVLSGGGLVWAQEVPERADLTEEDQRPAAATPRPDQRRAGDEHPLKRRVREFLQRDNAESKGGFFVAFGDIKSGSGLAAGPGYSGRFSNGVAWRAKAVYSVRHFKLGELSLQGPSLAGGRLVLGGRVRWQDAPTLDAYGLGNDSTPIRAEFGERMTAVGGEAIFTPEPSARLTVASGLEFYSTGPGRPGRLRLDDVLGDMPGLYADPAYLHSVVSGSFDTRDAEGYSREGTFVGFAAHDYRQQDAGPYSFRRLDLDAEQFVPLARVSSGLFFRASASFTNTDAGNTVPFFLMPTLGGGKSLRGYDTYRFRDRNALLLTGEYRWHAHEYFDVAMFYDAGTVAASGRDLALRGLKGSGGVGLRLHTRESTVLRVDVAYGREGYQFIVAFGR